LATLKSLENDTRHVFVPGDICDYALVLSLLKKYQVRAVVNFAAESHVDRSIHGPVDFIQTNIVGTFNLLEAVRVYWNDLPVIKKQEFRFLHVSTDEVYGSLSPTEPAFSEINPYEPNSPYSASKAASDHLVRAWHHTYGLPVLTTNCSNNYGPYHFPEKLIPLIIANALAGKALPIYGDGQQTRSFCYVDDLIDAMVKMMNSEAGFTGPVNTGNPGEFTMLQLAETILRLPNSKSKLVFAPLPSDDPKQRQPDIALAKAKLGWEPKVNLEDGLKETIAYFKALLANT
jgi:dTDP-glucose 4,6-dehydratase